MGAASQEQAFAAAHAAGHETDDLVLRSDVPDWWHEGNNKLLAPAGMQLPILDLASHDEGRPTNALAILHSNGTYRLIVWGSGSIVFVGSDCKLTGAELRAGSARLTIRHGYSAAPRLEIDARNGGEIEIGQMCMSGPGVRIATDDMHPIRDVTTGRRLNAFGGTIRLEDRVWLGAETIVAGGATVGHDTVVGARSLVTGFLPPNSVCVGVPAKVVRSGIYWEKEDVL